MPPKERKLELNPLTIGGLIVAVIAIILLVVSLMQIFRKNPYGPETRIDNVNVIKPELPQTQKDQIFSQLYNVLQDNLIDEEPPESGALIREGTVEYKYDEETDVHVVSFIVDVPSVEQSYKAQLEWSSDKNNQHLGGYSVVVACLPKNLRIYESQQGCVDIFERILVWENAYQLDYTFGSATSLKIQTALGGALVGEDEDLNDLTAVIDEVSLKKLRDQPDLTYQYEIMLDGKKYKITTRVDVTFGRDYIALYIDGASKKQGIILTNEESLAEELSTWLKSLSGRANLEITVEKN